MKAVAYACKYGNQSANEVLNWGRVTLDMFNSAIEKLNQEESEAVKTAGKVRKK